MATSRGRVQDSDRSTRSKTRCEKLLKEQERRQEDVEQHTMEKLLNFFMESCKLSSEESKHAINLILKSPNRLQGTIDVSSFLLLACKMNYVGAHELSVKALDIYSAERSTLGSMSLCLTVSTEALDSGSAKLVMADCHTSTDISKEVSRLSLTSAGSSNLRADSFYYQDMGRQALGSQVDVNAFPVQADGKVTECLWPSRLWKKQLGKVSAEAFFKQQISLQEKRGYPKYVKSIFMRAKGDLCHPKQPDFYLVKKNTDKLTNEEVGAILFTQSTSQDRNYADEAAVGEATAVGLKFLYNTPKNRSYVFVGATNLRAIRWYKVSRYDVGVTNRSGETASVRESLAGFMCCPFENLGLSSVVVKAGKALYPLDRCLGEGHTSHVYRVCVDSKDYAVKMPKSKMSVSKDILYLTKLQGIKGVPSINIAFSNKKALFMQPVCFEFTRDMFAKTNFRNGSLGELVDTLQSAHERRVGNRDVRLNNVMITADYHFVIVDWGFAAPLGERVLYSGTTHFASGRVLRLLERKEKFISFEAADDLISLVQMLWLFTRFDSAEQNKLFALNKHDYAGVRTFWERFFVEDWFKQLVELASNHKYSSLKDCMQSWAENL